MFNPISSVNKFISETPANAVFFKSIVLAPVIGILVQNWKNSIVQDQLQKHELAKNNLDKLGALDKMFKFSMNREKRAKVCEIRDLSRYSKHYGSYVDIASLIASFVVFPFYPKTGASIAFISITSFLARELMVHSICDESVWDND
jgi:hypothetical protein